MVKEMDAHDKGLSSSVFTKASEFLRVSASDENDQAHQEMGSNIQNTEKFPPKHNMSQTISAAAKVAVPRRKILAERNEAPESFFSNTTHAPKTPNSESKFNFVNPGTGVFDVSSPESFASDDNEPNAHVADGSLRPYDPLTNLLSPRPKFLRYKPHRRREIFLRREKEVREGIEGLYINTSGSFEFWKGSDEEDDSVRVHGSLASSDEDSVQKEREEIDDSDEEIEGSDEEIEEEEERGRGLKKALESLLCIFLLVLSALYISSVSIAPSSRLQSLDDLKGGYYNIQNLTSEAFLAMRLESEINICDKVEEIQIGLDHPGRHRANEGMIEEGKMVEDLKTGRVKISEVLNEVVYGNGGEFEALEMAEDEKRGAVDELRESTEPQAVDVDEGSEQDMMRIGGFSGRMAKNSELQNGETIKKFEAFQDYRAPSTFDGGDHQIIESDITNIVIEENDILMEPAKEVHNDPDGEEEVNLDGMGTDTDFKILNLEAEGNLEYAIPNHYYETELLLLRSVIGISVLSMILASLFLVFHFKRKKFSGKGYSLIAKRCSESRIVEQVKTGGKNASLIPKPPSESLRIGESKTIRKEGLVKPFIEPVAAEEHCSVLPNGEEVHMERADSFVIHSSFDPKEGSSEDDYESRAPTIELLGEFVIGEISSSLRSRGTKNRGIGSEESNYSVSTEKKSGSKVHHSVSLQPQSTFPELSDMVDSHSCARYTTEKKVMTREGSKGGEAKVITTPVRRSSRIRHRSLASP